MPNLSVIVPVFGDSQFLEACLESIRQSEYRDYEVIVTDDGSPEPERIAATCRSNGVRLVRLERNQGPGPARNAAARLAAGEILVFIDSDETVPAQTLGRIAALLEAEPSLDAVVGSFDPAPGCKGRVALFRNLLHTQVHHRSAGRMTTFWAGCGAVRRRRFEDLGGFHAHPVEDVEFGIRLSKAGGRIRLEPSIQVKHHKEWTLASMIWTDVVIRAAPWTELMMTHGLPDNLNFRWRDRTAFAAATLIPAMTWLALQHGGAWAGLAAAMVAVVVGLQMPLFRFLGRQRGVAFAAMSVPLYLVHQWSAGAGLILGLARWERKKDRWIPWVAAAAAVAVFGVVQWGGGAYQAEFDGYSDEAAHFMTGLMLRDYAVQWPIPDSVRWAEQYYIHYPRVALGQWPPLFHALEATWWLFVPPSRVTAMLLIGMLAVASTLGFYRLARRTAPAPWALVATGLLVAAPEFQRAAAQVMTEQLNLVLAILFLEALAGFVQGGEKREALKLGIYGCLSLLVKGTGLALLPAPLVAMTISRQWRAIRRFAAPALAVGAVVGAIAVWYLMRDPSPGTMLRWAGIRAGSGWSPQPLTSLAGPGALLLAVAGMALLVRSGNALATSCTAVLLSTVAVAYVVRAMNEGRHLIAALPCILLLDLLVLRMALRLRTRFARAAALAGGVAAIAIPFPWLFYRQSGAGVEKLAGQLKQPARMLVSAHIPAREGSWVIAVSARESRPSSLVVRSTKALAELSFDGRRYRLRVRNAAAVGAWLDRYGIDTVVLDEYPLASMAPAHHELLRAAVTHGGAWSECARSGPLFAYCRTGPPMVPREPLRIEVRRQGRTFVVEQ